MTWIRGHVLGHGASATVSAAAFLHNGEIFALKSAELSQSESLQREQNFFSTLNNPYIVGYKGYDISRENNKLMFNLMLEYMPGGTIRDAIHRHGGRLDESTIKYYTKQILQGLEYLHSRGIVHCDIKASNILLGDSGVVKIADLDCAKWLNDESETASFAGTPMFMAPEVVQGKEQSFPADIWALGCTLIEMATGALPWPNITQLAPLLQKIALSGNSLEIPHSLSDQARDFLSKCLIINPRRRWTAKQLLEHTFVKELRVNLNSKSYSRDSNTSSPTNILDHEIRKCVHAAAIEMGSVPSDSPSQRIGKLCFGFQRIDNWEWNENSWINVRGNGD